jgi:hypothetical protein
MKQNITDAPIIRSEVTYLEMTSNPTLDPVDLTPFRLERTSYLSVSAYLDIYKASCTL